MKTIEERDRERLNHIRKAIDRIEYYISDIDENEFINDSKTNEAVLFQLTVIGEAINHISRKLLEKYDYPWHSVRALRNVIAHEYFGIMMDKLWITVREDLPGLKDIIGQMLKNEF